MYFQKSVDYLTKIAQDYSEKCVFKHMENNNYGECLFIISYDYNNFSMFCLSVANT